MGITRLLKGIFISGFLVFFICSFTNTLRADQSKKKSFNLDINSNLVRTTIDAVDVNQINGYSRVQITGLNNFGRPGEPRLPFKTIRFLLPYGRNLSNVKVSWTNRKVVYGSYMVEPAQAPVRLSYKGAVRLTAPNSTVYNSASPFPGKQYEVVSIQNLRGFKIAVMNLFPVEYIPATGQLAYYENMSLNLQLVPSSVSLPYELYRGIESDFQVVRGSVDNPEIVDTYPVNHSESLLQEEYIIITSDAFAAYSGPNSLADLAAHKTSKWGLTTAIINETNWSSYDGTRPDGYNDNATKIRNCIIANYDSNKTQYVLLVGDADYTDDDSVIIPMGISMENAEKEIIKATLFHENGNKTRTAEILGIGRKTLHRKINEYGLNSSDS